LRERVPLTSEDDFFCLRYQVWYPSFDCAIRTRFYTFPGCSACDQGRFNLRRHSITLNRDYRRLRLLHADG
jgi:hypothetical protein